MQAKTVEDITYRTVNGIDLLGLLYRPDCAGPAPFIIDVHGGAWASGDRLNNQIIHQNFVKQGIGVFALDFRLSSQIQFPGPVQDTNYGIRWFKANASTLGIEISKIGGLGSSSGAQQMGLVALQPKEKIYVDGDPSLEGVDAQVDFFIACWPILDPFARYQMAKKSGKERLVDAHLAYFADEDAMSVGNPFMVLERGDATHLPPTVIIQGGADENVDHFRADLFSESFRAVGGRIELHKFPGQPHTFVTNDPENQASKEALQKLNKFVLSQVV